MLIVRENSTGFAAGRAPVPSAAAYHIQIGRAPARAREHAERHRRSQQPTAADSSKVSRRSRYSAVGLLSTQLLPFVELRFHVLTAGFSSRVSSSAFFRIA